MFHFVAENEQSVFVRPDETASCILFHVHLGNFEELQDPLGVALTLLTGSMVGMHTNGYACVVDPDSLMILLAYRMSFDDVRQERCTSRVVELLKTAAVWRQTLVRGPNNDDSLDFEAESDATEANAASETPPQAHDFI